MRYDWGVSFGNDWNSAMNFQCRIRWDDIGRFGRFGWGSGTAKSQPDQSISATAAQFDPIFHVDQNVHGDLISRDVALLVFAI